MTCPPAPSIPGTVKYYIIRVLMVQLSIINMKNNFTTFARTLFFIEIAFQTISNKNTKGSKIKQGQPPFAKETNVFLLAINSDLRTISPPWTHSPKLKPCLVVVVVAVHHFSFVSFLFGISFFM